MVDLMGLAEIVIVGGFGILALREIRVFAVKRGQQKTTQFKYANPEKGFNGLSALIVNNDEILGQLYKMRDETIAAGADEKALAPLNSRIKAMETLRDWRPIIEPLAPHLDKIVGVGLKAVERIVEAI